MIGTGAVGGAPPAKSASASNEPAGAAAGVDGEGRGREDFDAVDHGVPRDRREPDGDLAGGHVRRRVERLDEGDVWPPAVAKISKWLSTGVPLMATLKRWPAAFQ